jgi:hypothetical protein
MEIVSVLFDKREFTIKEAQKMLDDMNLKPIKPVHATEKFFRFRIQEPRLFKSFKTHVVNNNIKFIYGKK